MTNAQQVTANTGLIQYFSNNKAGTIIQLGYDKSNRLVSASNWAGHSYAYTYDADGNRTTTRVDGKLTQSLTFTVDNQIASTGYGYDKAGRRTADAKAGTTTWNDLGQAVGQKSGASTGSLSYAGLGQDELIRQTSGSTVDGYTYGRDNQAGIPTVEYVTATGATDTLIDNDAHGQPIGFQEGASAQFVMYDGTGRMIGTVDTAGANTSTYHLDPYGALLSITSGGRTTMATPYASTTPAGASKHGPNTLTPSTASAGSGGSQSPWATFGIEGAVSRQWKRGARWNDTFTGTWTSTDPITTLNDPSRANPYTYAGDDPINMIDPAGRDWWNDLGGMALACGESGLVGAETGGEAGIWLGVGTFAAGAAIGGLYGCGAGIIPEGALGFNLFQDW